MNTATLTRAASSLTVTREPVIVPAQRQPLSKKRLRQIDICWRLLEQEHQLTLITESEACWQQHDKEPDSTIAIPPLEFSTRTKPLSEGRIRKYQTVAVEVLREQRLLALKALRKLRASKKSRKVKCRARKVTKRRKVQRHKKARKTLIRQIKQAMGG